MKKAEILHFKGFQLFGCVEKYLISSEENVFLVLFGILLNEDVLILSSKCGRLPGFCGAGDLPVKCRFSSLRIGNEPQVSDAQCRNAEKRPSNKTEMQAEQAPSVSVHHLFGPPDCLAGGKLRMLRQDITGHGIAVGGDDAWYNQKQRPEKDIDGLQNLGNDGSLPDGEAGEQNAKRRHLPIRQRQVEAGVADCYDASQQQEQEAENQCAPDKIRSFFYNKSCSIGI